jgi:hypothetical protein
MPLLLKIIITMLLVSIPGALGYSERDTSRGLWHYYSGISAAIWGAVLITGCIMFVVFVLALTWGS